MALTLWYHPLSSFCWKVLIPLYEADIAFTHREVQLFDPQDRAAYLKVWPLAKLPVLTDDERGETVPESSLIIEYLARKYPSAASLLPADPDAARPVLIRDRVADNYIHAPFFAIVGERLRDGPKDPFGVEQSKAAIARGYDALAPLIEGPWAMGETFTLADCAAFPALYYADYAVKLDEWPTLRAYVDRLKTRPSVARVLKEAEPVFHMFPLKDG
ncbi:glutathione S-transferase family protein [Phenylobacterium sp.]|jgi:glutathione S-transferase|uniref:glutathione S-transferase family protein n=1 Tax=Phenylobacterium sp. TaxID=1871053 RepID=UPI002F4063B4